MAHRARLAGIAVGDGLPVAVIGVLNVSPESFYPGSVRASSEELRRAAAAMCEEGAALLDVGAMSTAPYLDTRISEAEERDRLAEAVRVLASTVDIALSADTSRASVARAALEAGASVINDVTGLAGDEALAPVVAAAGAGLIAMASERDRTEAETSPSSSAAAPSPIDVVGARLRESLAIAERAGIPPESIVVDPGIGFFRQSGRPSHEWDCRVLAELGRLRCLDRPICVGASRKSFIGVLTHEPDPGRRLAGSVAAATSAVLSGAQVIRAHDVGETVQAVRVAEALRACGARRD